MTNVAQKFPVLEFNFTKFNVVDRNNQPWLKSSEIALALGYADQSSINRIYARRADEFSEKMTGSVKLTDPNGDFQETRIFSLRGAHLLAMFARTGIAKKFREWLLDVIENNASQEKSQPMPQGTLIDLMRKRWLVSYDAHGREQLQSVPEDAAVMNRKEYLMSLTDGSRLNITKEELAEFVIAATKRLANW